jgi:ABC-type antimicrobial peptide transport system permease subunit
MFSQSVKQIFRSVWRYKSFTVINLLGLSIGIAATVILVLISQYENDFDQQHSDTDQLFRVVRRELQSDKEGFSANVPYPTARYFRNEFAGAVATQLHFADDMNVRIGNNAPFEETNVLFADSLFFQVMDFANVKGFWKIGNPQTALSEPRKALLTQSTATKYFGEANPVGQIIRLDNKEDVEVVGVVKDPAATTHLPFSMIVSFSTLTAEFNAGISLDQWGMVSGGYSYVRLNNKVAQQDAEKALASIVQKYSENPVEQRVRMYLQPVRQIHFDPSFEDSNPSYTVSERYLTMLLLLGGFILLIACVNYINLSTSLAFTKSKEVGIRKTIGASRPQLFLHYLSETFFLTSIAALIGIILAVCALPLVNDLLNKSIEVSQLVTPPFIAGAFSTLVLVSFISGVYPALILSGFNPIYSLKNKVALPGRSSTLLRKGLVVFQFAISVTLIICTIVIARQMAYFNGKELGFNKEAVVEVGLPVSDSVRREKFRTLLQANSGIQNFSFCLGAPITDNSFSTTLKAAELSAKNEYIIRLIPSDSSYLKTYGLQLIAGRGFLPGEEKGWGNGIIVNEKLVKTLGYKDPADVIGKTITIGLNDLKPPIIGVTKDFHTASLHKSIEPVGLLPFSYFYYAAGIRIGGGNTQGTLADIEAAWKRVYPESVYSLHFIDETLATRYEQETRDYALFKAFSAISIFICCMGLWGLIAFVVVRKTKEIGIRKVLGASVNAIVVLLSKDFLKLVFIALLVASPVAWYFMHSWLESFAYRVDISWWIFVAAGLAALMIALFTISFQAIRAGFANPVKNLRSE